MATYQKTLPCLVVLGFALTACNTAHADRLAPVPRPEKALAQTPAESPYQVDLIDENGEALKVYRHRGRFYVLGMAGERYTIRVANPTSRRVEAVLSVDGLDVIDGKSADLRKRGYVVPAYGELRVDGFRVSTQQVATFRFSSVANSYAGRKGQARNVGVIGVAIFEEQAPPQIVVPEPRPVEQPYLGGNDEGRRYDYRMDLEEGSVDIEIDAKAKRAPAPMDDDDAPRAETSAPSRGAGGSAGSARTRSESAPRMSRKAADSAGAPAPLSADKYDPHCCEPVKERPGLGTEFGEQRYSTVTWTQFIRAHATRPNATVELRYNDVTGLQALGIQVNPVDADEIYLRETANPFPGGGFAQPPQ